MAIIKKKTWPEYFEEVLVGKKNYDLRLNDFEAKEGDVLVFEEWNPKTEKYTGRVVEKKITYVGKFDIKNSFWTEEEIREKGFQIFSLE